MRASTHRVYLRPMDDAEAPRHDAALRKAQHKLAALGHLGPQAGAGATIWARVVQDELDWHESARERFGTDPNLETWERLIGTALMLAVAIDQVLAFERRVRGLTGDAALARARERFTQSDQMRKTSETWSPTWTPGAMAAGPFWPWEMTS